MKFQVFLQFARNQLEEGQDGPDPNEQGSQRLSPSRVAPQPNIAAVQPNGTTNNGK